MDRGFVRINGATKIRRYRNVAGVALLAILIAFQFLQIYRYREVIIKNEANARQLERASEHAAMASERIAALDTSVHQLQSATDFRRSEVDQIKVSAAELSKQLEAVTANNAALRDRIEEMKRGQEDIFARLTRELHEMTAGGTLTDQIDKLKRSVHEDYDAALKRLENLAANSAVLNQQIDSLRREQEVSRARIAAVNLSAAPHSHGRNVFVGVGSGNAMKDHAIGEADDPNAASFNAAIGQNALGTNRNGSSNTAAGSSALGLNEGGSDNAAVGANALGSNISGNGNVAVGSAAMYRNISGGHNSAVGLQALYGLVEGRNNSAFGRDAMFTLKNGSWNSAYGVDALPGLEHGEGNSAFGGEAGYTENRDNQHRLGSFNSWFGYQSGPASLKQVSNSIAIGYQAKNTDSNQTVIGNAKTAETILFGDVKVQRLCIGSSCLDATSLKALLAATPEQQGSGPRQRRGRDRL